jgi:thioredoxin reductase (NADPH)
MKYDIIIIGAGPAGLSAGIYAARGGLKTAIFERGIIGGQIMLTTEVENYPGYENVISGYKLIDQMSLQAQKFGVDIIEKEITAVALDGLCKIIETESGMYEAKSIILCTGAHPRRLKIPGEERLIGRGVSNCATCDGALYRNKTVAVIGGGDSAVEEALFLTKFTSKVYIIHRRDKLRAIYTIQERAFKNEKIEFIWNTVPLEILGDDRIESLLLLNKETDITSELAVDGCFIYVGILPNNQLLESRVELDELGFVKTDEYMHTNIPGIYAAGDIRQKVLRQIVTAVADGATAAWSAEKWVEENRDKFCHDVIVK